MNKFGPIKTAALGISMSLVMVWPSLAAQPVELAAARDITTTSQPQQSLGQRSTLVRRIQQGLSEQGFYLGAIDGIYGRETDRAIRAYQKNSGLKPDGQPSETLALSLETGGRVSKLLGRLQKARAKATDDARKALMSRPETRNLLEGNVDTGTDMTHDSELCFLQPSPRCLLREASMAADGIEKDEMRSWALGEILAAQAKAGLAEDAMQSTRRIHDPQLIMVALRDIAKSQAEAGRHAEAMSAVDIIPDVDKQIEAYVAITEIQADRGNLTEAGNTAAHLIPYLERLDNPLAKIAIRTRLAVILHRGGAPDLAKQNLRAADRLARTINDESDHEEALRHIASALAEVGEPDRALKTLRAVKNGSHDTPVLMAAATGQALAGASDAALITADAIEAVRYRALVLSRIAAYQAGAGDGEQARETLERAMEAAKTIRFPFAKAYAFSRIALSYNDVGISTGDDAAALKKSLDVARLISDDRLRAHILWTITDERTSSQSAYQEVSRNKAIDATDDIKSPLSRVWMLCDIAETRAREGNSAGAWAMYDDAYKEAISISNAWGRARALAKVALTLTGLADLATSQ